MKVQTIQGGWVGRNRHRMAHHVLVEMAAANHLLLQLGGLSRHIAGKMPAGEKAGLKAAGTLFLQAESRT